MGSIAHSHKYTHRVSLCARTLALCVNLILVLRAGLSVSASFCETNISWRVRLCVCQKSATHFLLVRRARRVRGGSNPVRCCPQRVSVLRSPFCCIYARASVRATPCGALHKQLVRDSHKRVHSHEGAAAIARPNACRRSPRCRGAAQRPACAVSSDRRTSQQHLRRSALAVVASALMAHWQQQQRRLQHRPNGGCSSECAA